MVDGLTLTELVVGMLVPLNGWIVLRIWYHSIRLTRIETQLEGKCRTQKDHEVRLRYAEAHIAQDCPMKNHNGAQ
jgi:hypothetical protein